MARPRVACKVFNLLEAKLAAASSSAPRLTPYDDAWRYQKLLLEHIGRQRKVGQPVEDAMLLVQHPSVYTLGRGATVDNLKFVPRTDDADGDDGGDAARAPLVYRIERGGEVTWHGPGQVCTVSSIPFCHTLELTPLRTAPAWADRLLPHLGPAQPQERPTLVYIHTRCAPPRRFQPPSRLVLSSACPHHIYILHTQRMP